MSDLYEDQKERKTISDALRKNGFLKNEAVNLVKKDGTPIICSIWATSVKDENGKIIHYDGTVVDITTKIAAESALKASEQKYYKLFESSKDAIMTLNPPTWKFTSGNNAILEMFQVDNIDTFTSLGPWDLSPEKQPDGQLSADKAKEMIDIAMSEGSNFFEWTHKKYNGKPFPATVLLTKIELKNEIFLQATVRDISKQERSEEINKTLFKISNAINTTHHLNDLYKSIHQSLGGVIDVTNFFIAMVNLKERTLNFPYFVDETDDDFASITDFNVNDSLTGMVVAKRKPLLLNTKALEERADQNGIWGPTPVIWMGVPLTIRDEIIGVIVVQSYSNPNLYNEQDLFMLSAVSDQVAIALDRKQAEEKLSKSEKKYRDLFEKSKDAVLIIQNDRFVDCNQSTVKMLRYKNKKEFLNTHPSELSPERQPNGQLSSEKADEMINIAFKNGSHRFEWDHKRADGEVFPVEVLLTAITSGGNNQVLHTVWRDITERKEMQKALQSSEEKLRTTIENIKDIVIYKMDGNGKYTYVSSAVSNVLGYLPKEMEGTSGFSYFNKEYLPKVKEKMAARIAGDTTPTEIEMVAKDGSLIPMEIFSSAIKDEDGTLIGFSGTARDVSERLEAEKALKESEEWFSTIIDQTLDGVTVSTLEGEYAYVNSTFCTMMGYTSDELLKMTVFDMKNDRGEIGRKEYEKSQSKKSGTVIEVELKRKDKSTFISEVTGKPIIIGGMDLVLDIVKDISERKQTELLIKKNVHQRGKLLEIARELGSSLDLNYILNTITARTLDLLESKGSTIYLLDDNKRYLKPIATNDEPYEKNVMSHKVDINSSLSGKALKSKKGMLFNNASQHLNAYQIPGTSKEDNEHLIVLPLLNDKEVFGTLNIYRENKIYTKEDVDFAETFALSASSAIQNAKANQELVREIHDRKLAVMSLRESENRFERLFNDLGDAVFVTELSGPNGGKILEINRAAERQTGYSRKELLKMNIVKDLYISGTGETKEDDWEERLKDGEIVVTSEKKKRKDGTEYWTDVIITAIEFVGKVVCLSINHDITNRKEADEKLKSRNYELELFNEVTVDREIKMIELKKEINKMLVRSGKESKYDIIT